MLVLSIGYNYYSVDISKQILKGEKVLEIFLQNHILSQDDISKLTGVGRSSVEFILRRYKETQSIERKAGSGKKK